MTNAAARMKPVDERAETFEALKKVFKPHLKRLNVTIDNDSCLYMEAKSTFRGRPMCFGAVRKGKAYVSFHLMALYCFPEMKNTLSPELKKRMQGKQCFNFTKSDPALIEELNGLVVEALRRFSAIKSWDELLKTAKCD